MAKGRAWSPACPTATCEVHAFCPMPTPPHPAPGPWADRLLQGSAECGRACSVGCHVGWAQPRRGHHRGGNARALGRTVRDGGLGGFCPTPPRPVLSWGRLQVEGAPCVAAASPCDFCLCPGLPSSGSEEMRRGVSLGPPWSRGLGVYGVPSSAGEPCPRSVPPPGRGGSEKEGVRDPSFWARKVEKAEVRGVARLSGHRRGTMQTPADFPRIERDSRPCPRKVSRGLASLQQCLSPRR